MGKAIFIEKIERKNAISIYILVANLSTSKRVFFVAKLLYSILDFFINAIMLPLKCCSAKSGIFLPSIMDSYLLFNFSSVMIDSIPFAHFL